MLMTKSPLISYYWSLFSDKFTSLTIFLHETNFWSGGITYFIFIQVLVFLTPIPGKTMITYNGLEFSQ